MWRLACGLALVVPVVSLAQPSALEHADLSRGATLPPTSAALADEAPSALLLNPAGLSQIRGAQLFYLHERSIARNDVIDGLYFGDTAFDLIGFGVGVEWIRSTTRPDVLHPDRRKTTWGLSLGSRTLSLGASLGFFSSEESRFLDRSTTLDVGLLTRPVEALSLGVTVRNLNEPRERDGAGLLPRSYELALGVRPFGERFTAGVDYRFDDARGFGDGRFGYVVQAQVIRGLSLQAGVSHGLQPSRELGIQLGATIDLGGFGASYATGTAGGGLDHVVMARLSAAPYPSLSLGGAGKVALLDLTGALAGSDGTTVALLGGSETDRYLKLTRLLAQAERDPTLAALVVKIESLPEVGLGRAEELRQALVRLRQAGKKVTAVIFTGEDSEYLVASGADRIYLVPQSMLLVNGLAANVTFLGGTMEKLGVQWDVARVGAYKNAPDQLTRSDMSDEQRETIEAYLDAEIGHLERTLAQMRNLTVEQVRAAMKEGLLTPKRAVELGLVDGIIQPEELDQRIKELSPDARFSGEYGLEAPARGEWGARKQIAIIPVVGSIASGKSREDPLGFAEIAGAETVVRALRSAQEDPDVAAIVIRVDSGGGDALSSDLMYRAVLEAKKKKPVIASMGDVAASGGYYAAMGANRIFASPTTITGSIGIFMMKPAVGGLAEKLGARAETIKRGELSTLLSSWEPWTDEERTAAQKWVDAFYDDFITEVAASRSMEKQRVDELARGRVWAGATAKERGLVDELGTLWDAVDHARLQAGIPDGDRYELVIAGDEGSFLGSLAQSPLAREVVQRQLGDAALPGLSPSTRELVRALGVPPAVLLEPGAKALMPFRIEVR